MIEVPDSSIKIIVVLGLLGIYGTGVVIGITRNEAVRVEKLKQLATPQLLYRDFMKTDEFLLPWLKARNMDPAAASEMLKNALKWRQENNVDSVISEDLNCDKYYPSIIDAKDKVGRPIWQIPMRKWDVRKYILGTGNAEGFLRCVVQYFEIMGEKVRNSTTTTNSTQFVLLADLSGFNLRQHTCIECVAAYVNAMRFYETYYPRAIAKMYLINTPQIFEATLELGKAVMSQESKDLLDVYGFDKNIWQAALLKDIDKDELTPDFGGTRKLLV